MVSELCKKVTALRLFVQTVERDSFELDRGVIR